MEKLVKSGLVRSIGVSNFNSQQIDRILTNCEIKPVTNQVCRDRYNMNLCEWISLKCLIKKTTLGWMLPKNQSKEVD